MTKESPEEKQQAHRRLLMRLEMQGHDVDRLTRGLSEEILSKRAIPDKWSLKELLCHMVITQAVFAERAATMLREEHTTLKSYDPEEDPEFDVAKTRPMGVLISQFWADRTRLVRLLEPLTPAEWHRTGEHPEFAHYDIHFLVEYMVYHEAHHLYQMLWRRKDQGKIPH